MRIDTLDAVDTFETLGRAIKEAGVGRYNGFLLVDELRKAGFRLVLERIPEQTQTAAVAEISAMVIKSEAPAEAA